MIRVPCSTERALFRNAFRGMYRGAVLLTKAPLKKGVCCCAPAMASPSLGIQALLLHESVLFQSTRHGGADPAAARGSVQLRPGADRLLYRLRFSNLLDALLRSTGALEFVKLVSLDKDHPEVALEEFCESWKVPRRSCILFASTIDEIFREAPRENKWIIVLLASGDKECNYISKTREVKHIDHILYVVADLNKKAFGNTIILVGHHMKWSREKDFLKRGAFPISPTLNSLSFVPMSLHCSTEDQIAPIDVLLMKATDEIVSWEHLSGQLINGIKFSESFKKIASYLREHASISVIDPLEHIVPLMDRFATQDLLDSVIQEINASSPKIRAPRSAKMETINQSSFVEDSDVGKLGVPTIVKPQIACGASDSHIMAVVLREEGYQGLQVPQPALVQEYIDHGSRIYKFYILGHKLFFSQQSSMPNAADLPSDNAVLNFDSLKSLPVSEKRAHGQSPLIGDESLAQLNLAAVEHFAAALRARLRLTLLGFDIVIQEGTNDHVIVDVNYFPSFKDIPNSEAIPYFWNAIKDRHLLRT